MSYILEALRKAEQQRRLGDAPGLDEVQPAESSEKPSWKWGWIALGVINAALLMAILFWPDDKSSDEGEIRISDYNSEAVTPADPVRSTTQKPAQPEIMQLPSVVPPSDTLDNAVTIQDAPPPLRAIPPPVRSAPGKITPGRVVQAETVIEPEDEVVDKEVESTDLPIWPQLSANLLGQLNDGLKLDVHVYAERAEERFVLINLQKYREGDQLSEGPTLEVVTPEGVIMSYQGERFRVNAK
jgi:general secretion pathway protein B